MAWQKITEMPSNEPSIHSIPEDLVSEFITQAVRVSQGLMHNLLNFLSFNANLSHINDVANQSTPGCSSQNFLLADRTLFK